MNGPAKGPIRRAPLPAWWWNLSLVQRRRSAAAVVCSLIAVLWILLLRDTETEAEKFLGELEPTRVARWEALAECESETDWELDSGNGFFGGLQFTHESWLQVGGEDFPHDHPRAEQIFRAEMLHDLQGWEAWPACSEQLGFN